MAKTDSQVVAAPATPAQQVRPRDILVVLDTLAVTDLQDQQAQVTLVQQVQRPAMQAVKDMMVALATLVVKATQDQRV